MMVGRLLSYWEGNFSGAMLNFGRVCHFLFEHIMTMTSYDQFMMLYKNNKEWTRTVQKHLVAKQYFKKKHGDKKTAFIYS